MNRLPDLRRFLKEEEKFNDYMFLDMVWINHHNPDLVILDEEGNEKDRIDLTNYSYREVRSLLKRKGFVKKGE